LLQRLVTDAADLPRCWPTSAIARCLGGGPPPLMALVQALRQRGYRAAASGVMPSQVRSDAPWSLILEVASGLAQAQDC
jgi:tRNA (guanine26-N2/guanine27-N2)-dimethyltransferase